MNSRTKIVLICAGLLITLSGLFPPWRERADIPYKLHFDKSLGYSFIWSPPSSTLVGAPQFSNFSNATTIQVDLSRLFIEWIIVAAVTAVLFLFLRSQIHKR